MHLLLLGFVFDEASGFPETDTKSPKKIYKMCVSSAKTRFGDKYKCFIISYPRYANDFIEKMNEIAENRLHWYADKAATWEFKPRHFFKKETFEFEGFQIPMDFRFKLIQISLVTTTKTSEKHE